MITYRAASMIVLALGSLLVCVHSVQSAQPAQEESADVVAIRAAGRAFVVALSDPDIATSRRLLPASAELKLLEAMHRTLHRMETYRAACIKAFPELAQKPDSPAMRVSPSLARLQQLVKRGSVTIEGDSAQISLKGFRFKKTNGSWKLVSLVGPDDDIAVKTSLMNAYLEAADQTLPEVEHGKFAKPADIDTAFRARLTKALKAGLEEVDRARKSGTPSK